MLDNIKSLFFIRILFSHLNERTKLKIVKYNQNLQNTINIGLINYKFLGTKYIIYETKGTGKEYDKYTNVLLFEGEYKNGLRNGKGKEYHDLEILLFEGEYLNNKRWNGKGYDDYNNVVYELKNGKGYIKEYYIGTILKLEGEYADV